MNIIPNNVFQTWKSLTLPRACVEERDIMIKRNPNYKFYLYDDNMIEEWIKIKCSHTEHQAFKKLTVGAAKADLWRYLILYYQGGIYLDIDSKFLAPIHEIVKPSDECIISRESNQGYFLQWFLAFQPKHPALKRVIELVINSINANVSCNPFWTTGPAPYSLALNQYFSKALSGHINLYETEDTTINKLVSKSQLKFKGTFYGTDLNGKAEFKTSYSDQFYLEEMHWSRVI